MKHLYNKIAIIDTGCNSNYIGKNKISGYSLRLEKNGQVKKIDKYDDIIGHGTAVTCIIDQMLDDAQIVVIKIDEVYCQKHGLAKWLCVALNYILLNENFDVLNISLGCYDGDEVSHIEDVCNKIRQQGTIIVSAFDNNGIMSYPASFCSVIGVDSNPFIETGKYVYVDEVVNVVASVKKWNLPSMCNIYSKATGNSFASPEFSARIYNWLIEGVSPNEIRSMLMKNAKEIVGSPQQEDFEKNEIKINSAITYPFSKEVSVLARFEETLNFNIYGYYDHPLLGKVNTEIGKAYRCENSHKIRSINELNWFENFDTVILSHVDILSQMLRVNIAEEIIDKCLLYKKNLFLFDENDCFGKYSYKELVEIFKKNDLWIRTPRKNFAVNFQWGGKLFNLSSPVLCVAGTDSSQGKFTVQVALRKFLKKLNINVNNFGTEPTSELLGFEGVYTLGYNAYMPFEGWRNIIAVNHALHQLENNLPDIIITGLQSRTIAPTIGAFKSYPIKQHEFITACSPDTYVLCINIDDSISYVKRTITYLESVFPSKVIALCINDISSPFSKSKLIKERVKYKLILGKKVFCISSEKSLCSLAECVIQYYK